MKICVSVDKTTETQEIDKFYIIWYKYIHVVGKHMETYGRKARSLRCEYNTMAVRLHLLIMQLFFVHLNNTYLTKKSGLWATTNFLWEEEEKMENIEVVEVVEVEGLEEIVCPGDGCFCC